MFVEHKYVTDGLGAFQWSGVNIYTPYISSFQPGNDGSSVPSGSGHSTRDAIIQGALAIGSQLVTAFGKRPSQQVYTATGYPATTQADTSAAGNAAAGNATSVGADAGATAGKFFDGIMSFVTLHPIAVGAVAVGLFLLYRKPPQRRGY